MFLGLMAKRLPPLNPLRAFEATARHASLTKAAAELNVTHGAISHQIKALEQSLGVKLFERTGQRVKLTPHGAELLPAVSTAFDGIAAATPAHDPAGQRRHAFGVLRAGAALALDDAATGQLHGAISRHQADADPLQRRQGHSRA
ncbi:hypothetical protein MESS2_1160067 [Mesorhizobium metallidurans STM 2683]|uniref:HTH lysR-type domain-containing protein n=1 Tax=Mesorhizobium metallidurans STM 2683 TaxID=1297569 RepID=M5EWA7_9HYPH|nr:hypothetical protein MESS2_1160067 [Mesorhizobium metallidurans STM 2683]